MSLLRSVTLGQYVPGASLAHRLDPRAKLGILAIGTASTFTCQHVVPALLPGAAAIVGAGAAGLRMRWFVSGLRAVVPLVALSLLANALFGQGEDVIARLGPIAVTRESLQHGLLMSARLLSLYLLTSLFTLTTSPVRLTDALESILSPFRRIGLPTSDLSTAVSIALRFIPTLADHADKIMKAQISRGARLNEGRLLSRARALVPVLVPLFVQAFHAAEALAEAMESRCYRGVGRTRLCEIRGSGIDLIAVWGVGALALALSAFDGLRWPGGP